MGIWSGQLLPRLLARGLGKPRFADQRGPALRGVSGRVLELGFGAGHSLAHYPDAVSEVLALEPAEVNRRLARRRIEASPIPVSWVGLSGEEIPLDDASVDAVTSAWTLCSIPDLGRALAEVRRVLRPGGALFFLEHGRSPDPRIARRQRLLAPLTRFCTGCDPDRVIDACLREAGFEVRELAHPPFAGSKLVVLYRGVAVPRA